MAETSTRVGTKKSGSSSTNGRTVTLEQWAEAGLHTVTCPSGAKVRVKIPDLAVMLSQGAIPEHLRGVAIKAITDDLDLSLPEGDEKGEGGLNVELMNDSLGLHRWLVAEAVVEPDISVEHLEQQLIPNEDFELLLRIVRRERDQDAEGVTLGVDPLSRWERFRKFHGCDSLESCEACEKARGSFSTHGMDDV